MAEKLPSLNLAIRVIDHIHQLKVLTELLQVCRNELHDPPDREKALDRIELLLNSYLSQSEYHFNELECYGNHLQAGLIEIRRLIAPDSVV